MSFWIMISIMFATGIIGGIVNYLLPGNNPEPKKYLKPLLNCIILGIGATLLVPLFLVITDSKLMDDIRFDCKWVATVKDSTKPVDTIKITIAKDSTGKAKSDTAVIKTPAKMAAGGTSSTGKNYLLWAAYCLLAAAAGFKFINMLINNVVKDDQLNKEKNKNEELEKEKEKRTKNSQISQQLEDKNIREELTKKAIGDIKDIKTFMAEKAELPVLPILSPVLHPEDPQKGRFGGKPENNERKISATVTASSVPEFYTVKLVVETTNPANPLNTDVIFYIHDSFSPSVFTYMPEEFKNGKAIEDEILSYGAFTIGVITDNGKTMLELDLAEDKNFPKEFRKR